MKILNDFIIWYFQYNKSFQKGRINFVILRLFLTEKNLGLSAQLVSNQGPCENRK